MLHAGRGDRLHLVGRSREKLDELMCRLGTVSVSVEGADLGDLDACAGIVERAIETLGGLDRVLVAHGDLGEQELSERSWSEAERILRVNYLSPVALLMPLANHFEKQRSGSIGVITSVAGERGRPRNYTYGSAKGGLNVYLQGLKSRLYRKGVHVTTLKLGPVDTPMTRDHEKTALFGEKSAVARDIVSAMDAGRAAAFSPWFWRYIMLVVRNTPEWLFQRLSFLSGR